MAGPVPSPGYYNAPGRLTPQQIRQKYQELAHILNELERQGEEIDLVHNEQIIEIRGMTARAFRMPQFKATWRNE